MGLADPDDLWPCKLEMSSILKQRESSRFAGCSCRMDGGDPIRDDLWHTGEVEVALHASYEMGRRR